jgi:glycerophosphoryl diester phosphodiesterase
MTKDGELFITHDSNLERTTNGTGVLEEKTADEIKALDTKKGNKMLLFDEFVKWIASKGDMEYVEFELKTKPEKYYPEDKLHEYCDRIYKSVMAVKPANALFIITSSDERGLLYIKNKYPDAQLLWIVSKPVNDETIDKCLSLGIPRIGAMMEGTSRAMVKKAHDKGLIVSLWPSHTLDDIMLGVYLGSNTLCTDIPIKTKKFITKKAKWIKAEF